MNSGMTGAMASAPVRANYITSINGRVALKPLSRFDYLTPSFVRPRNIVYANTIRSFRPISNGDFEVPSFAVESVNSLSVLQNGGPDQSLLYVGRGPNNNFVSLAGGITGAQHGVSIGSAANAQIGSVCISPTDVNSADNVSVAIGASVTATATSSVAIGRSCSATHVRSVALSAGVSSRAGGMFYSPDQTYQTYNGVASVVTTNNTPTRLQVSGPANILIPSGRFIAFTAFIAGIRSTGGNAAVYYRKGAIKNVAGTTSLVGTIETIGTDIEDDAATDVAITANNTDDCLDIHVTGITGETWRWQANLHFVEFPYGT